MPPVVEVAALMFVALARDGIHTGADVLCNDGFVLRYRGHGEQMGELAAPAGMLLAIGHSKELRFAAELVSVEFGLDVGVSNAVDRGDGFGVTG